MQILDDRIAALEARARMRAAVPHPIDHIVGRTSTHGQSLRSPIQVRVDIIERCSQSCIFCVQAHGIRRTGQWTLARFEAFVQELASVGVASLVVSGGEPGCHPDLPQLLLAAKHQGLAVQLETTGIDLSPAALEVISDRFVHGQDRVVLSLDAATRDSYHQIRGVDGFLQLGSVLRYFAQQRIPFSTHTVIVSENLEEIPEIARLAGQHGAVQSVFSQPHSAGWREARPSLSQEQILDAYEALLDSPAEQALQLSLAKLRTGASESATHCPAGLSSCNFDAQGRAATCAWWSEHGQTTERWEPGSFLTHWDKVRLHRDTITGIPCCANPD